MSQTDTQMGRSGETYAEGKIEQGRIFGHVSGGRYQVIPLYYLVGKKERK